MRMRLDHHFETPLRVIIQPPPSGGVFITASLDGGLAITAKADDMAYTMPDETKVDLSVAYVDANGNAAEVQHIHWEASNPDTLDVVAKADGSPDATLFARKVGKAQVVVRADADMGDGVKELVTTLDVDVVAGEAVAGTITPAGSPEPI